MPWSSTATSSPSSHESCSSSRANAAATAGIRCDQSWPLRVKQRASPPSTCATMRYPSNLSSVSHCPEVGTESTAVASCGAMKVGADGLVVARPALLRLPSRPDVYNSVTSSPLAGRAAWASRPLISSQFCLPRSAFSSRTSDQRPWRRSPSSVKSSLPRASDCSTSPSGCQLPRSQIRTLPAPYSPAGMSPLKVRYSNG